MWGTEKETQPLPQGIYNKNIEALCQNVGAIEMCARSAEGFTSILVLYSKTAVQIVACFLCHILKLPSRSLP